MSQTRLDQFYQVSSAVTRQKLANNCAMKRKSSMETNVTPKKSKQSPRARRHGGVVQRTAYTKHVQKVDENNILIRNESQEYSIQQQYDISSNNSSRKIIFTPKKSSPIKKRLDLCNKANVKRLFPESDNKDLLGVTIEHFNLSKEGAILPNNFDLAKLYKDGIFTLFYNRINTATRMKYEVTDVVMPVDACSKQLFLIITTVFHNPLNCGYFNEDELDFIFSILTLSTKAQALFVRMLRKKRSWHRLRCIKYPKIDDDLQPIFVELVQHSICKSDIEKEEIEVLLQLLQADEGKKISQEVKMKSSGRKNANLSNLLKLSNNSKPLFPGAKSPADALRGLIINTLGYCVRLTNKAADTFDKIITLLIPNQDPQEHISDLFSMLLNVQNGQLIFPQIPAVHFPIFCSADHLSCYIESKKVLSNLLSAAERKYWRVVCDLGLLAYERASILLRSKSTSNEEFVLPSHVKHFSPTYLWLKVMSKSISAFKKFPDMMHQAVKLLRTLIEQKEYMQSRRGQWYMELALIEMHHKKNLEVSASVTLEALTEVTLSDVDRVELLARATRLSKRKTGITPSKKQQIELLLGREDTRVLPMIEPKHSTISAVLMPGSVVGRKNTWHIAGSGEGMYYGSVEQLAKYHYRQRGYSKGIHCEGAFPVILFTVLFWEEIYEISVPGVWISMYQSAPEDLYTEAFADNRKKEIDTKIQLLYSLDTNSLSKLIQTKYETYRIYKSIMQMDLFVNSSDLGELVECMGTMGVMGICQRLVSNYKLWNSGFPDLVVWDPITARCKIVEVKGPSDSLSTKQHLWLQYLSQMGLDTEVCKVTAQ